MVKLVEVLPQSSSIFELARTGAEGAPRVGFTRGVFAKPLESTALYRTPCCGKGCTPPFFQVPIRTGAPLTRSKQTTCKLFLDQLYRYAIIHESGEHGPYVLAPLCALFCILDAFAGHPRRVVLPTPVGSVHPSQLPSGQQYIPVSSLFSAVWALLQKRLHLLHSTTFSYPLFSSTCSLFVPLKIVIFFIFNALPPLACKHGGGCLIQARNP